MVCDTEYVLAYTYSRRALHTHDDAQLSETLLSSETGVTMEVTSRLYYHQKSHMVLALRTSFFCIILISCCRHFTSYGAIFFQTHWKLLKKSAKHPPLSAQSGADATISCLPPVFGLWTLLGPQLEMRSNALLGFGI